MNSWFEISTLFSNITTLLVVHSCHRYPTKNICTTAQLQHKISATFWGVPGVPPPKRQQPKQGTSGAPPLTGALIQVEEIETFGDHLRARVDVPAGWITLKNTATGKCLGVLKRLEKGGFWELGFGTKRCEGWANLKEKDMMYGDVVGLKRWEEQIGNMVIAYVLQSILWFCASIWHCSCFACDNWHDKQKINHENRCISWR